MIQITFTPETPEQAAVVAKAIASYLGVAAVGETVAEVVEIPKETVAKKPRAKAAVESASTNEAPNVAAESTPAQEVESKEQAASSSTSSVSLETVRGLLAKLSGEGKRAEVTALIAEFGATKLTEVPADKYAELYAAAEAL